MKIRKVGILSIQYFRYLLARMTHDRVNVNAGYLAYITLLSIVPMLTVLLSILSSFSVFADVGIVIQNFIITNFVPASGDAVHGALLEFVANTGKMTAVGSVFLFIAALMLISNIDKNLNYIWRVTEKRRAVLSFSMYWMVLTLGPILVGASIAATSYVTSLSLLQNEVVSSAFNTLIRKLPLILSFLRSLVYTYWYLIRKSTFLMQLLALWWRHYCSNSVRKASLLTSLSFPSYQVIYGALAAIPILFVWVYLCWLIVLVGAEVTAALGEKEEWSETQKIMVHSTDNDKITEQGNNSDSTDSESK
ncbi:virulence factor BrkB family protein [Vibrio chagasii]